MDLGKPHKSIWWKENLSSNETTEYNHNNIIHIFIKASFFSSFFFLVHILLKWNEKCNIPTLSSFPNTVLSARAEQFQRPCLNWNWHSLIPIWTPSPITMMASGRLWQIVLWRGAKPGILLQMMLAPSATTDDRPLRWRREVTMWLFFWKFCRCFHIIIIMDTWCWLITHA